MGLNPTPTSMAPMRRRKEKKRKTLTRTNKTRKRVVDQTASEDARVELRQATTVVDGKRSEKRIKIRTG